MYTQKWKGKPLSNKNNITSLKTNENLKSTKTWRFVDQELLKIGPPQ